MLLLFSPRSVQRISRLWDGFVFPRGTFLAAVLSSPLRCKTPHTSHPKQQEGGRGKKGVSSPEAVQEALCGASVSSSVAEMEADLASFSLEAVYHKQFGFYWPPIAGMRGTDGTPRTDGSSAVCKAEFRGAGGQSVC